MDIKQCQQSKCKLKGVFPATVPTPQMTLIFSWSNQKMIKVTILLFMNNNNIIQMSHNLNYQRPKGQLVYHIIDDLH